MSSNRPPRPRPSLCAPHSPADPATAMPAPHLLAVDQGTTSTRAVVTEASGRPIATAQAELRQHFPGPGWVEHDPEEIWASTLAVGRDALAAANLEARDIAGI